MKVTGIGSIEPAGHVAINAATRRLAIGCVRGLLSRGATEYRLYQLDNMVSFEKLGFGDAAICNHLAFDRSGNFLASAEGGPDYFIQGWLYDVAAKRNYVIRFGGPRGSAQGGRMGSDFAAFGPAATSLALSSHWDRPVCVDLQALVGRGEVNGFALAQKDLYFWSYAWSPDGMTLARVAWTGSRLVYLWRFKNGEQTLAADISAQGATFKGPGHEFVGGRVGLAFSPDSRWLAAGPAEAKRGIQVFDAEANTLLCESAALPSPVRVLSFTPGGEFLVSGDDDGNLIVWKLQPEGTPGLTVVEAEKAPGRLLALSLAQAADGLYLAHKVTDKVVGVTHVALPDGVR